MEYMTDDESISNKPEDSSAKSLNNDTIVAIATPAGRGSIGVIRLSGSLSLFIAQKITNKQKIQPRKILYTNLYDSRSDVIDEAVLLYFKAPHSFTGEDVVEFQSHGSPFVLDSIVEQCLGMGARIARPGEFSERAFLNQKIDLAQAEAIADLIDASSQSAAKMAVRSLQGEFSKRIQALNENIIHLRTYLEATIDFSDEDIDFIQEGKVIQQIKNLSSSIREIREQAAQGVLMREGISVVIAGPPNAGKSTLINRLSNKDVAIVTPIPGTTRDVMREYIVLDDIPIHIVDTAGLRESQDLVEQEGIKRAIKEIQNADCVLWVIDINNPVSAQDINVSLPVELPQDIPVITVVNKIDSCENIAKIVNPLSSVDKISNTLVQASTHPPDSHLIPVPEEKEISKTALKDHKIFISAQTGEGFDDLKKQIKSCIGYQDNQGIFLARRRHLQALDQALRCIEFAELELNNNTGVELVAENLRLAHHALSEIMGEFTSDDLLGEIFSTFCIGK